MLLSGSVMATMNSPGCWFEPRDGECGLDPRPGIGQEGQRLGGRTRLAGDDPECREGIEVVHDRADRGRVGGIEDPQIEVALRGAEDPIEHVRGQAGAAHPHDDGRPEAGDADPVAEALERRDLVA